MMPSNTDTLEKTAMAVKSAVQKHGSAPDSLIPVLSEINTALGYLPNQALEQVSSQMKIPPSQVFSVASFYQMFSTIPVGRHVLRFCESAPCHVVGGRQVFEQLIESLGIPPGQTTPDGKWTFLTVSCLGICAVGPAFMVDQDVYGNVTASKVAEILDKYQ